MRAMVKIYALPPFARRKRRMGQPSSLAEKGGPPANKSACNDHRFSTKEDGLMFIGGGMDTDQGVSLLSHGDQLEKETWTKLEPYLSKYEIVWRMLVVPLRAPGSIYLRVGINPDLETFAMNNYTAYVNMTRALSKIESNADDLKFAEEIWANLQRAVEVASKAAKAFSESYRDCTRKDAKINTEQLDSAETSVKIYRNRLHHPI